MKRSKKVTRQSKSAKGVKAKSNYTRKREYLHRAAKWGFEFVTDKPWK